MSSSSKSLWNSLFSHIYIEEKAYAYPLTEKILSRFDGSIKIDIKHYKDVFCRPGQSFQLQKNSPKLILAVKTGTLLYEGSRMCDSFGHENFYYTTHAMNCVYNCEYCYLQGMYPSANIVVFVNIGDVFDAAANLAADRPLYICVSYETDLLPIENITGFIHSWSGFIADGTYPIELEIRTKSASFNAVSDLKPDDAIVIAWTLSPQEIIDKFEHGAPSLTARISAVNAALDKGWKVRLCFDPLLNVDDFEMTYKRFIGQVFAAVDVKKISDISVGAFRLSKDCYNKMKKSLPYSEILEGGLYTDGGSVSYKNESSLIESFKNMLSTALIP